MSPPRTAGRDHGALLCSHATKETPRHIERNTHKMHTIPCSIYPNDLLEVSPAAELGGVRVGVTGWNGEADVVLDPAAVGALVSALLECVALVPSE